MKKLLFILFLLFLFFLSGCNFSYKKNNLEIPVIRIEDDILKWNKINNVEKYKIEINLEVYETRENEYSLKELSLGEYEIKVKAVYKNKEGSYSYPLIYKVLPVLENAWNLRIEENRVLFDKDDSEAIAFIYKNKELLGYTLDNYFDLGSNDKLKLNDEIEVILKKEGYKDSLGIKIIYSYLETPSDLRIENKILYFEKVRGAEYYLIYLNQELLVKTTNNYHEINITIPGNYLIEVEAVNDKSTSIKAKINYRVIENIEILKSPQVKLNQGVLVWEHIKEAISYQISINNGLYIDIGYVNTYNSELIKAGSNIIRLMAISSNPLYNSLEFKGEFVKLETPTNVFVNDQNISWYSVNNASSYKIYIEYINEKKEEIISNYTSIYLTSPEIKNVKISALSPGFLSSDYSLDFDKQNMDNPDFYAGIGSRKRPFIISNYIHLINMNKYINQNKYFELKNDIDLKDNEWIPFDFEFNGFFDGNGYKIYNFKIKNNQNNIYFIKSSSGSIMNLDLEYGIISSLSNINIGGLLQTNNGNIENVNLNISIILKKPKVGNISGFCNSNLSLGSISKSKFRITFSVEDYELLEDLNLAGVSLNNEGFIHDIEGYLLYENSFNNLKGNINMSLVSINNLGSIEEILVDGIIDLKGTITKQIEINYGGISINNFNKIHNSKSVVDVSVSIEENNFLETIYLTGISKTGKIFNSSFEGNLSASGSNIFLFGIGGDEINNSKFYGDIYGYSLKEEGYLGGIGNNPINVNNSNFEGNIKGFGKNLYVGGINAFNNKTAFSYYIGEMNLSGSNILVGGICGINNGLIEYSDSTIDLSIVNGKLINAGGIVGENYGHIKDVNSISNMNIKSDESNLGGIVGKNNKENNIIEKTYSSVNIKADGIICNQGGLIGNSINGVIRNSYSIGVLNAPNKTLYSKAGGLIGNNELNAVVKNCYAIVNIESSFYSGGFIGHNKGSVKNCYSIGRVEANAYAGGLIGFNEGIIIDSFYDIEKSNQNDKDKGVGLNSSQMRTPNIFSRWNEFISLEDVLINIDNVWIFEEGSIPKLYFQ